MEEDGRSTSALVLPLQLPAGSFSSKRVRVAPVSARPCALAPVASPPPSTDSACSTSRLRTTRSSPARPRGFSCTRPSTRRSTPGRSARRISAATSSPRSSTRVRPAIICHTILGDRSRAPRGIEVLLAEFVLPSSSNAPGIAAST
eukprot:scaffold132762_cov30-Tisochrysis_lutea.AAC.3